MSNIFEQYREQLAGIDESNFIGDVLTFEFRQPKVTHDDLVKWFAELDLDEQYIPPEIKLVDAFRRATGERAVRSYTYPNGRSAELMVRNVSSDRERVIRHIVREIRDPKGRKLQYDEVGEAIFYKAGRTARAKGLGGDSMSLRLIEKNLSHATDEKEARELIKKIDADYKFFSLHYYTQAIRDMVRNYVVGLNSISLRSSGGVYFVHKTRRDALLRLTELVNNRIGDGCRIHMMPLLDAGYQREMLTEAFQDQVEANCDKLLTEVARVNEKHGKGKVPPSSYVTLQEMLGDVMSRSEEYTRVLGLAQGRAGSAIEVAMDAIADIASRLEVAS